VVGTLYYMQPELHAKVSRNKYPHKARIGGFGAKTYASDSFLRVVTVYFRRAAAATPCIAALDSVYGTFQTRLTRKNETRVKPGQDLYRKIARSLLQ
jgi:hypothetical protein